MDQWQQEQKYRIQYEKRGAPALDAYALESLKKHSRWGDEYQEPSWKILCLPFHSFKPRSFASSQYMTLAQGRSPRNRHRCQVQTGFHFLRY